MRWLQKDCIVVPTAANMYIQVVQSDQILRWNTFLPIAVAGSSDIKPPPEVSSCPGSSCVHDLQMDQLKLDMFTPISEPAKIFRLVEAG